VKGEGFAQHVLPYAAAIALFIVSAASSGSQAAACRPSRTTRSSSELGSQLCDMGYLVFRGLGYALAAGVPRDTAYARATRDLPFWCLLAFVRTDGWSATFAYPGPLFSVSVQPGQGSSVNRCSSRRVPSSKRDSGSRH